MPVTMTNDIHTPGYYIHPPYLKLESQNIIKFLEKQKSSTECDFDG